MSSPSPSTPSQPIGLAYQPRSIPSCSAIISRASPRGSPPTAGVGWRRSARASRPAWADSRPRTGVTRCWTSRSGRIPGVAADLQRLGQRDEAVAEHLDHHRVFLALLPARQQRGRQRGILRRRVPARRRARDRDGLEVASGRAHEPLGGRAEERLAAPHERVDRALRRTGRQATQGVLDIDLDRRSQVDPTGEHHLVEPAPADGSGEQAHKTIPRSAIRPLADQCQRHVRRSRHHGATGRAERSRPRHERIPDGLRAPDLTSVATRPAGGRGHVRERHERASVGPRVGQLWKHERRCAERAPGIIVGGQLTREAQTAQQHGPDAARRSGRNVDHGAGVEVLPGGRGASELFGARGFHGPGAADTDQRETDRRLQPQGHLEVLLARRDEQADHIDFLRRPRDGLQGPG